MFSQRTRRRLAQAGLSAPNSNNGASIILATTGVFELTNGETIDMYVVNESGSDDLKTRSAELKASEA